MEFQSGFLIDPSTLANCLLLNAYSGWVWSFKIGRDMFCGNWVHQGFSVLRVRLSMFAEVQFGKGQLCKN